MVDAVAVGKVKCIFRATSQKIPVDFGSLCPGSNPGRVASKTRRRRGLARDCCFREHSKAELRNHGGTELFLFSAPCIPARPQCDCVGSTEKSLEHLTLHFCRCRLRLLLPNIAAPGAR